MSKIIWIIFRVIITLFAWVTGGYFLHKFEYFKAFGEIDNVIGILPAALAITGAGAITAVLWMKHTKQFIPVSATLALFAVLSAALFPTALRGNWWANITTLEGTEAQPDLAAYAPFSENSKTVKLGEKSTLTLTSDLPVLDGALALYPVYAAFAEAVYNKNSFSQNDVLCTNTRGAYEAVISGERDIIFVAGASEKQLAAARDAGADLQFIPIGREAFVFLTGKSNPINSITYQQIRNIYSGKTSIWRTLG
ncbi:MAG: substrate-binding domain-containing protein, partial [Acidobacteriota bacterium]|nr:substrate-binding domain-containing protein [Acidobacteriota bacterium]